MINTLIKTFQIDLAYSVNSFFYFLRKLPIFNDLITDDIYKSKSLKKVISFFVIIFDIIKAITGKLFYFFIIFLVTTEFFSGSNSLKIFCHLYFFLTLFGMLINSKALRANKKKYLAIVLFNMDAINYYKNSLLWNLITDGLLNTLGLGLFMLLISPNTLLYTSVLVLFSIFARIIGDAINIYYYQKCDYIWYTNSYLYLLSIILLLGPCLLPFINVNISFNIISVVTIIFMLVGVLAFKYLFTKKDYKLLLKKICITTHVLDSSSEKDYLRQARVEVKEKDKIIDTKILEHKKGYDLFNTIFFERHRELLLRSAKKYALIIGIIYLVLFYSVLRYSVFRASAFLFLKYNLAIFVIIMYYINRGQIVTQAMFFNCDHAMLTYNFYREPKVILGLFKKRVSTLVKVNLLPALVIALGNVGLILLTSNKIDYLTCITTFLFIISLSVFFSVHYLVLYYLLQPYTKNMQMKKVTYSIISLLTYIVSYSLKDLRFTSTYLSILGIVFVIGYLIMSLLLVYKIAPKTFKLNE